MPKDDERKEMTQEEIDAREEKFRTFFTTSVAQVPEEMTRRDDENEEKPKSLLGRLLRREKGEQQESGTPEESRTGEIQLGGEEPEEPSDLELVLTLEEEVTEPKPEQPKPAEPVSAPQPETEKPQKPAEPIKAPEPPAPKPEKKPAEKQAAPRKKAVQYEPRTPQELAVYIPLTETTAPAPVRLAGVICETPEAYIDDIAAVGMTAEDFVYTYGDYYIDSELTPDTGSSFWSLIASFLGLAAFVLLASAALYTAQLNITLKQLKKGKLLERAESEFHYLEGDRRSDALVSTAFLYGRRQNIVLPLADVLWVYRHDLKLLWAKRTVVELLTYDGRSITLRLERGGSRRMADAIVQAVAARNPEALVGLNRENQRLYSQQVPHAKRKRVWATAAGIGGGVLGYAIARVLIRLLLS